MANYLAIQLILEIILFETVYILQHLVNGAYISVRLMYEHTLPVHRARAAHQKRADKGIFLVQFIIAHLLVKVFMVYDFVFAVTPTRCFDWKIYRERFFAIRKDHNVQNTNYEEEDVFRNRTTFWMLIATMFTAITLNF